MSRREYQIPKEPFTEHWIDAVLGPYREVPIFLVDMPDVQRYLDAIPKLVAVAKAARDLSLVGFEPVDNQELEALNDLRAALRGD